MNSSVTLSASPALASLYAPPRARVAQVIPTVAGWRGFGHAQRVAIVANCLLLVLLAGIAVLVLRSYPGGRDEMLWMPLFAAPPLLCVFGLWPCRSWWPLRALMLLVNLLWFGALLWFAIVMLATVGINTFNLDAAKTFGAVFLVGLLPPGAALWAQVGGWLRG